MYRYRNDFCRDVYVQGHGCRDVQYCIGTRMAAIGTLLAAGMYMGPWALGQESGLAAGMNMSRTDYMDVLGRIQV